MIIEIEADKEGAQKPVEKPNTVSGNDQLVEGNEIRSSNRKSKQSIVNVLSKIPIIETPIASPRSIVLKSSLPQENEESRNILENEESCQ